MSPFVVTRTYKGKRRKKRPWANIHNVLSEIKNKGEKESVAVFDALFTKNIKIHKSQRARKNYRNKENENSEKVQHKRTMQTKFDTVNLILSFQDLCLDSTFDQILAGPVFQQLKPLNVSHESKDLSSSSISTSGNQCDIKNSVSEPSYDNTLFPSTWETRKEAEASMSSRIPNNFPAKVNVPLKFRNCKKQKNKNETLDMNSCITSTPKGISCNGRNQTPPRLSPILHSVDKVQESETSGEIIKEKKDSYPGVHPAQDLCENPYPSNVDSDQCASINEVTDRCRGNRNLSPSESRNKSVILFDSWDSVNSRKFEPTFQSPSENTDIIVCGRSQVLKSGMLHSHLQSSLCLDNTRQHAQDFAIQNSKEGLLHSYLSLKPIMPSRDIDKSLHISDSRCHPAQKSSVLRVLSRHTEGLLCNDVSKRHSLQDSSMDADESHISDPRSCPAQKSVVQSAEKEELLCSDVSRSNILQESSVYTNQLHISDPRGCPTLESAVYNTDKEELLYSDVSKGYLSHESLADTDESHISNQRHHLIQESAVLCTYQELLCSSVSKSHALQKSSVDTDKFHSIDLKSYCAQESAVNSREKEEILCSDVSKSHVLQESSADIGKLSISTEIVKKQKPLRLRSARRLSHQVVAGQVPFEPQLKSPSFRDVHHISPCKTVIKCRSEITVALPNVAEEFKLPSIIEEPLVCVPDAFTARDAVLQRCHQLAPISFSEAFSSSYWLTCKKIGEGAYGEVFLSEGQDRSVLKIIPIEGEACVNGEPQKKFEEILSEIVIAMELSSLRNGSENRTYSFSEVKHCLCVQGTYPEELIDLWEEYDDRKGSENDSPTMFKKDQLYIILVLADGGCDLEAHFLTTADQSYSVFIQTAYALAVAELVLEFEHRDLHWGNVLVSPTTEKHVMFILCGKEYYVPTKGVKVTVIDFTLSRMAYDGCCIYNDLSKDPALFIAKGDYQFEVYRLMQKHTLNSWHHFKPYTNLLWLHYLLDKMCTMVNYRCTSTKSHKQGMKMLKKLQGIILSYSSAQEFILSEVA